MSHAPSAAPDDAVDGPFWAGLATGELRIQRCAACERWTWPPQWRCGACGSWEMVWPTVPMTGIVHAVTYTRHPFSAEAVDKVPYPNLLVELPEAGGARLLGLLAGDEAGLAIGARVTGVIEADAKTGLPALRWTLVGGDA